MRKKIVTKWQGRGDSGLARLLKVAAMMLLMLVTGAQSAWADKVVEANNIAEVIIPFNASATPEPGTVTLNDGEENPTTWQGKAGDGSFGNFPLTGVAEGTKVTLKYTGDRDVKSITASKK
jgi:hypothetical protein